MNKLEKAFPSLRNSDYKITSEKDPGYNCIAWAAGFDNIWWWPDPSPFAYWPEETRECSVEAFVRVFTSMGYEICHSAEHETGFEKVAIYEKDGVPQHMARQLSNGYWTSKCGGDEDIQHTLGSLEDSDYGKVSIIMKRKAADSGT
jgi:hypothetical protein